MIQIELNKVIDLKDKFAILEGKIAKGELGMDGNGGINKAVEGIKQDID